ncbi:hypothetical protein BDF14DRAFT_1867727 [Spinellus fusiger]|nr:hypothetical protein BDF14DRAFT_1867727 [Spinellus fusiger]
MNPKRKYVYEMVDYICLIILYNIISPILVSKNTKKTILVSMIFIKYILLRIGPLLITITKYLCSFI